MPSIPELRKKIDVIDEKIVKLLSQRGKSVKLIGSLKDKAKGPYHIPEREASLLNRLKNLNPGPYSNDSLEAIFREIMSASLSLEAPLQIAYLGPEGTFTHLAARRKFGTSCSFLPQESLRDVFIEVDSGRVDYGIVPIENSTEGVVNHTLDLFMDFQLTISGEVSLDIHHNLASKLSDMKKIKKVYSHLQPLAQCRNWLEKNLPHAETHSVASTAAAAALAKKEAGSAAICSQVAAEQNQLKILGRNIEDRSNNVTRFLIIGKYAPKPSGKDKTSIMFSTRDEVGVLAKILQNFAKINLSKIESRPKKQHLWEYIFFIDLDGHMNDAPVAQALKKTQGMCSFIKVLGSYPRGINV